MLRNRTTAPLAAAALAAASFTAGQVQTPKVDPATLEMQAQIAEFEGRIDFLETFVAAQAKAGAELAKSLSDARAKGFTAGINPESREALLAGLGAQAEAMKTGEAAPDDEYEAPRSRRRSERGKRRTPR